MTMMSLWKRFTEPLPIRKRWSVLIRCVMYGWPLAVMLLALLIMLMRYWSREKAYTAMTVATELEMAIERFYEDNGTMPLELNEDSTVKSDTKEGVEMIRILLGPDNGGSKLSVKSPKYLNIRHGNNNKNGLMYNDSGELTGLYDPWGGPYVIRLNGDLNERIEVQPKAGKKAETLKRRVAVWSDGKNPEDPKDDVKTW